MGCLIKTLILKNQAGAYVPAFSLGIKKRKGALQIFPELRALRRSQKLQAFTELILFAGVILCLNVKNVNAKSFISPATIFFPARSAFTLSILYGIWSISGRK